MLNSIHTSSAKPEFSKNFTPQNMSDKPTILVIGGNGYVGSRMCEQAILNGYKVISISRSGTKPSWLSSSVWAKEVEYVKGDALKPESMKGYFKGNIRGVISCVGCFHWKQSVMQAINGDTNINACKVAKEYNVPKFVYVSAWRPSVVFMGGSWNPLSWIVVPGYFGGKKRAEEVVESEYGDYGVSFRAGMVSGKRYISDSTAIPLDTMSVLFSWIIPTINVDDLAKAAVRFIKSEKENTDKHICENGDISDFYLSC